MGALSFLDLILLGQAEMILEAAPLQDRILLVDLNALVIILMEDDTIEDQVADILVRNRSSIEDDTMTHNH